MTRHSSIGAGFIELSKTTSLEECVCVRERKFWSRRKFGCFHVERENGGEMKQIGCFIPARKDPDILFVHLMNFYLLFSMLHKERLSLGLFYYFI